MSTSLAEKIAVDMNSWLPKVRIEFAMQGEPLVNPNVTDILSTFHKNFPTAQLLITTNSDPLKDDFNESDRLSATPHIFRGHVQKDRIKSLFDAGAHTLLVNDYDANDQMLKDLQDIASSLGVSYFNYHEKGISPWSYRGTDHQEIVVMRWMEHLEDNDTKRALNNQAGNALTKVIEHYRPLRELPMKARCQLPFRELEIKQDGAITSCCMQWGRDMIIDFFPNHSLQEIWESQKFITVRKLLYEKERGLLAPCKGCDYVPFKTGLLKDPMPENVLPMVELAKTLSEETLIIPDFPLQ